MDNVPPTPVNIPLSVNSKKKPIFIFLAILVIIILLAGILILIRNYRVSQTPPLSVKSNIPADLPVDNRSLSITGKITDFDGKSIVIKKDSGKQGKLQVANNVRIFKLIDNKYLSASASSNLGDIQTNKDATLILIEEDGNYKVGTISYTVPVMTNIPLPNAKNIEFSTNADPNFIASPSASLSPLPPPIVPTPSVNPSTGP